MEKVLGFRNLYIPLYRTKCKAIYKTLAKKKLKNHAKSKRSIQAFRLT